MKAVAARMWLRWQSFWFAEGDLRPLALFRIGWSLGALLEARFLFQRVEFFAPGQYALPLISWVKPATESLSVALAWVAVIGALMALWGLLARVGVLLSTIAQGYLFSVNVLNFQNHSYLLILLGLLLACSPCGQVWSVDALVRRRWTRQPTTRIGSLWAVRHIQVLILVVYFWAVVNKLSLNFFGGFPLQKLVAHELPRSLLGKGLAGPLEAFKPMVDAALASDAFMAGFSVLAVAMEAFIMVGLPFRRLRPYAVAVGVALHFGIWLSMNVPTFGLLMVSTYLLFVGPDWLDKLPWSRRPGGPETRAPETRAPETRAPETRAPETRMTRGRKHAPRRIKPGRA